MGFVKIGCAVQHVRDLRRRSIRPAACRFQRRPNVGVGRLDHLTDDVVGTCRVLHLAAGASFDRPRDHRGGLPGFGGEGCARRLDLGEMQRIGGIPALGVLALLSIDCRRRCDAGMGRIR